MAAAKRKFILIADPDDDIAATAPAEPPPEVPIALHAKTLRDCERRISSRSTAFVGFFFNPALGHPGWVTMLKAGVSMHPNCPVFLICTGDPPLPDEELKKIKVVKVLRKPLKYEQLCQELGLGTPAARTEAAADSAEAAEAGLAEKSPEEAAKTDALYVPVRMSTLLTHGPLQFDVHVRLSAGHYAKAWKAGDTVDIAQLDKQAEKGVPHYCILKSDQEACLKACDDTVEKLIADPAVPLEMRTAEVLEAGAATIDFLKRTGVSQKSVVYAVNFAVTAQKAAAEVARNNGYLGKFLLDMAVQDHAISTAMLGSLVLTNMKATAGDMFKNFNLALLFHDVGLWDLDPKLREEDTASMTPEQLRLFHEHPARGAKILRDAGGFPNGLVEAVEMHHMRLGNKGFPARQGVAKVNVVAEMIGICSDFAQVLAKTKPENQSRALAEFLATAREGFSPAIVSAFERTFCALA